MREQFEVLCNSESFPDDPRMQWEYYSWNTRLKNSVENIQSRRKGSILQLRRISCHGRNYSQPYFFKRNQSSDNRSHGFGAKFLLKKLSASDFSYERKSAFRISLESELKSLTESLNDNSSDELFREYEECKNHLENFYHNVTNGLIIRSKVDWYEKGEKPNKYFYNLEKRNKAKTHVKSSIDESKNTVTHDQKLIMTNLKSFHTTLYSKKSLMSEKQCMEYLTDINIPVLSSEMKDLCDNYITLIEIFTALNAMSSNKTPGNDGLTKEFYLAFFETSGPKLLKSLNYALSVGELPTPQRQAVITLIKKWERWAINKKLAPNFIIECWCKDYL